MTEESKSHVCHLKASWMSRAISIIWAAASVTAIWSSVRAVAGGRYLLCWLLSHPPNIATVEQNVTHFLKWRLLCLLSPTVLTVLLLFLPSYPLKVTFRVYFCIILSKWKLTLFVALSFTHGTHKVNFNGSGANSICLLLYFPFFWILHNLLT